MNIERGVQLTGLDTEYETARDTRNVVTTRDVATIAGSLSPKVGNTLTVAGVNYKLDVLLEDAGVFRRFVLLKV